jgi:predicted GNAT family acetyltransferase
MRANEFITELFKPGKDWKWSRLGASIASAFFKVGGREYLWQAFTGSNPKKWEIQFRLVRNPEVDSDNLDLYGKTGTGNSAQVLSTAVDITRAFIKEYGIDRVEEITFNAKEDSRIGLYAKMIQRLLPNWDLHQKYTKDNGMEYHLTDRRAYDKPENKLSEEAKAVKYNGLTLKYAFNDNALVIKAFEQGSPIAYVKFVREGKELYPQDLWVNDDYRNRGVAKSMYDYLKSAGYIINRSHDQTKAGAGFWDKHRGEDEYVWEEINPDILDRRFAHKQQIGDYLYTANGGNNRLEIVAFDKKRNKVGHALFVIRGNYLESMDTEVSGEHRDQGIARAMYTYAKMLGNDIKASPFLLPGGEKMWKAWKKSGDAKHLTTEEVIDELFQPGKKWQWEFNGSEEAIATFHVGEVPYLFHAYGSDGQWEVEFKRDGKKLDRTQKFGLTGTGNSAEVMSTVVDIMRAFLDKYKGKIEVLIFSAKEDSRQGLYAKMVERLLPDWIMKQDGEEFILVAPTKIGEEILDESKMVDLGYFGIQLNVAIDGATVDIRVLKDDKQIGYVYFERDGMDLIPEDLAIDQEYQRMRIATEVYDYVKSLGFKIHASKDQTQAGKAFWKSRRGDVRVWEEEIIDEMPLPADWDPQQMRQQGTTFKSRLAYALERAKKLGTGSSRVATIIEYQGRPTVLKIAKNQKGLAQNSVEASILDDGYASQMGILIPLIDYDTQNRDPSWIHTELAQKANEKQLCGLMKCQSLYDLIKAAHAQLNEFSNSRAILNDIIDKNEHFGSSEQDNDTFLEYVNSLAELKSSFDIELADFHRPVNWGLYKGKPVIIDVGFNSNVMNQYYK